MLPEGFSFSVHYRPEKGGWFYAFRLPGGKQVSRIIPGSEAINPERKDAKERAKIVAVPHIEGILEKSAKGGGPGATLPLDPSYPQAKESYLTIQKANL